MNKTLLFPLIVFVAACSHQEDVTVRINNLKIEAKDFFKVSANDLEQMDKATASPGKKTISLSSDRTATCEKLKCAVKGSKTLMGGDLGRSEISRLLKYQSEARKRSSEVKEINGPLTLRCSATECAADLFYQSEGPVEFNTQVTVKDSIDWGQVLIGSFVNGMFQAANR